MFAHKHKIMNSTGGTNGGGGKGESSKEQLFSRSRIVPKEKEVPAKEVLEISVIVDEDDDNAETQNSSGRSTRSLSTPSSNQSSKKLSTASKPIDIQTAKVIMALIQGKVPSQ